MPARLLIIALDGADGRRLDEGTRDGSLPNLAELRRRGRGWALSAPVASTDDSLWASFHYGVGLGEHGRYSYWLEDQAGRREFACIREMDRKTFWDRRSDAGDRVAIIDLPKCRRPAPLNGVQLNDWLTHGRYFLSPVSYPEGFAADVIARFGPAPPSLCGYQYDDPIDDQTLASVRGRLLHSVGQKRDAGMHYLSQAAWDLFAVGFKEAHCGAHMFWDVCDPSHPRHDAGRTARLGSPVQDVMRALDAAVGDLVAAAGAEAEVIVFSTTDFAPNGTAMHLIDAIAARIDAVVAASEGRGAATWLDRLRRRPRAYCRHISYSDHPNALCVPRLPHDTDAGHRRRVDLIADLARELATPEDGLPVVSEVSFPDRDHEGSRAGTLPQILLHYRAGICPPMVVSPRLGRISGPAPIVRPGNHIPGGFAIAAGRWAEVAARDVPTMTEFAALAETVLERG